MSLLDRLERLKRTALEMGQLAADMAMQQPEIRRRVDDLKNAYGEARDRIEEQLESLEDDIWVRVNRLQDDAQRLHRQVDRARNSQVYFARLGLRPGADMEEVKAAWRQKMRENHPDRFANDPAEEARAQKRAQEINLAYQELTALLTGREDRRGP
jgi:DnaJ-domain-containing protein 1